MLYIEGCVKKKNNVQLLRKTVGKNQYTTRKGFRERERERVVFVKL